MTNCSHCRFPLPKSDSGLRHYGTHAAHQESECLRLLHAEIARLTACLNAAEQVRHCAQRALEAWDNTVLPKNHDGMMFERMEDLRAALAGVGA